MRQLNMFKGPRQKGEAPPSPKEFALQCALADLVRRWILPPWRFTHIPHGEKRDKATAARLKRMGVMPGWPDFIFCGPERQVLFLELKRPRHGRETDEQGELKDVLVANGFEWVTSSDLTFVIDLLKTRGIVRARISA